MVTLGHSNAIKLINIFETSNLWFQFVAIFRTSERYNWETNSEKKKKVSLPPFMKTET